MSIDDPDYLLNGCGRTFYTIIENRPAPTISSIIYIGKAKDIKISIFFLIKSNHKTKDLKGIIIASLML